MKCPYCDTDDAYVGALFVECPNKACDHYNEDARLRRAYKLLKEYEDDKSIKITSTDPDTTPAYPWGFPSWPLDIED